MGPLLLFGLVAPAFAAEVPAAPPAQPGLRFGLSIGAETVFNDPFLNRHGGRVGFTVAPAPWVEVGTAVVGYPILGEGGEADPDWTRLSKQLLLHTDFAPYISKLVWQWQTVARLQMVRADLGGGWTAGIGLLAGGTVAGTRDDLVSSRNEDEERAMATEHEVHVGPVAGAYWDAGRGRFTLRVRVEFDGYVETVNSTTLELKKNALFGAELLWWFG